MVIKKHNRQLEVDDQNSKIYDYNLPNSSIGLSYQELNGRVPTSGAGVNSVCREWYYVISGNGSVTINDETESIEAGDVVVIEPNQASYLDAHDLKILTITDPDWNEQQYKLIGND